jgi:predicted O-methyltransferase YrrM
MYRFAHTGSTMQVDFSRTIGSIGTPRARPAPLLTPAARKAIRNRMLLLRTASLDRVRTLTGSSEAELKQYRHELQESELPELLVGRGASLAFVQEFPQGALLYLLVRALKPRRIVETGVRPGYSTAWFLAALEANGAGTLTSLGPGSGEGRTSGVENVGVGQFVPPSLRSRWTLVLGNTEERVQEILGADHSIDLYFYDNGPDPDRARFEIGRAWKALSPDGVLLAHRTQANRVWDEFCARQGVTTQLLDPGPPPLGALAVK